MPPPSGLEPERDVAPEGRIPFKWLHALDQGIASRGPDDSGVLRDRQVQDDESIVDVALVHRRLAIIDLQTGQQPFNQGGANYKGRISVVYNGCIYNHKELRRDLEAGKHRFETHHADGEVIVHGYKEWSPELPQRLEGMFAFAVWDARRCEIVLVRDRAGEKPLYTAPLPDGSGHAFASTPKALIKLIRLVAQDTGARDAVRPIGSAEWIAQGCGRNTPVAGIHSMPPASRTRIAVERGEVIVSSKAYWAPPTKRRATKGLSHDTLDKMLRSAVADRVQADVPVGAMLSGGVDSSLVCMYAQKAMLADRRHLQTFSLRNPDPQYDESGFAEAIAKGLNTKHRTIEVKTTAADDLIELITSLGIPFGDSSLLPTYWLCRGMRSFVPVALSGDGADELFCGYERHVAAPMLRNWGWLLRAAPLGLLPKKDPKSLGSKLARLGVAAARHGYSDITSIFPSDQLAKLLGSDSEPWLNRKDLTKTPQDAPLHDFVTYLPRDLLTKVDSASMAVGLEVRAPFLDTQLIEAALSEPQYNLMPGNKRKGMLRELAKAYFPAQIIDRPKMGFAIPVGKWLREDFGNLKQLSGDLLSVSDPWPDLDVRINKNAVKAMINEHMKGRRDHGQRIYMLTVLAIWAQDLKYNRNGASKARAA